MTNYVRTADFAGKDALISGNPAKAVKGVDLGIEFDAIAAMSATKLDASNSANPSVSVGLAIVNGTAASFMRSDAAPALSQAIVPTWTGVHTFSALPVLNAGLTVNSALATFNAGAAGTTGTWSGTHTFSKVLSAFNTGAIALTSTIPAWSMTETAAGADAKNWVFRAQGGAFIAHAYNDAGSVATEWLRVSRTGAAVSSVAFGNTTDNTTFNVLGTGTAAFGGAVTATDELGGVQELGYRALPQNAQAVSYTTVAADRGKSLVHTSGSAHTFTIAANASVAYPLGSVLTIINTGAGALTIAINADTLTWAATAGTGSRTLATAGIATAIKVAATSWILSGTGLT